MVVFQELAQRAMPNAWNFLEKCSQSRQTPILSSQLWEILCLIGWCSRDRATACKLNTFQTVSSLSVRLSNDCQYLGNAESLKHAVIVASTSLSWSAAPIWSWVSFSSIPNPGFVMDCKWRSWVLQKIISIKCKRSVLLTVYQSSSRSS